MPEYMATITVVNTMNIEMEYKIPVSLLGIGTGKKYRTLLTTDENGYKTKGKRLKDKDGVLTIRVKPGGAVIIRRKRLGNKKRNGKKSGRVE